ncbi:MAG: helix-turn-helix domain-containing protein [Motiliproteus sp.]
MTNPPIQIGIVQYPGVMMSAVQGLQELFYLANSFCEKYAVDRVFKTRLCTSEQLAETADSDAFQVIILPPCLGHDSHCVPDVSLLRWLVQQHSHGSIICSVCAGAFVLAEAGLLDQRPATTHWALSQQFTDQYPHIDLECDKILINDGDIITAGGLMSWIDLGLELVAQFSQPKIMRELGKYLVVDTAPREQRYYQSFSPRLDHGDKTIVKAQHHLQAYFHKPLLVTDLAALCYLTERTFLRRFVKATAWKPIQYLQRLRVQKACDLIESSTDSFAKIALNVGYEDISAFRKTFIKITGLTPKAFKNRFVSG